MKKIMLTAAIALFSLAVKAQSDNVQIPVTVTLYDMIVMSRLDAMVPTATFDHETDFDWGRYIGGWGWFQFKVKSNRHFNVTTDIGTVSFTPNGECEYNSSVDVNTGMTYADFSYLLGGSTYSKTIPTGATPDVTQDDFHIYAAGQNPVFSHADNGSDQEWYMQFLSHPEYQYTGGDYAATITVTATQE